MKTWEVIIPPAGGGTLRILSIEAATWMMALSEGLRQLADPAQLSSLMCNITPHGTLEIVDSKGRRTITIREIIEQSSAEPSPGLTPPSDAAPLAPDAPDAPLADRVPPVADPNTSAPAPPVEPDTASNGPVPPPDPSSKSSVTSTAPGLVALPEERNAAIPRPSSPTAKRQTAEMVALASNFFDKVPHVPPPGPPEAAPPVPPPPAKIGPDKDVSAGETSRPVETYRKHVTEPAIIIDPELQAEIEQLESLRKAREAAMSPPAMRPIPHKVFKVIAEAPEEPRPEAIRRRYVSVWPNPPQDALEEVLQLQLQQAQNELISFVLPRRVLVAAFDHAFEKIPLRPPIGLCSWAAEPGEEVAPLYVYGDQAAQLWDPNQSATGSTKSPAMGPAVDPRLVGVRPAAKEPARTAIVILPVVDPETGEIRDLDQEAPAPAYGGEAPVAMPPLSTPPVAAPPVATPPVAAPPMSTPPLSTPPVAMPPAAAPHGAPDGPTPGMAQPPMAGGSTYPVAPAPAPVPYPPGLQNTVYQGSPPAPTPPAPPASLDPHWAAPPAPAFTPSPAGVMRNLSALAFERMHALFYLTDRQNALAFSLDTALQIIPSVAGAILIYDPTPRELYLAVARGPGAPNPLGFRVPVHEGLAGFCAMEGLPLALSQVDQDQRFHTALSSHFGLAVNSIVGAPIQYEGRFYGVLELVNRQPDGPFQGEEVNALAYIARQLAERLATALAV